MVIEELFLLQQQSELSLDVTKHLTRLFYCGDDDWNERPESLVMHSGLDIAQYARDRAAVSRSSPDASKPIAVAGHSGDNNNSNSSSDGISSNKSLSDQEEASKAAKMKLIAESMAWLENIVKTQSGRGSFITVLNQFRSRKVRSFLCEVANYWETNYLLRNAFMNVCIVIF